MRALIRKVLTATVLLVWYGTVAGDTTTVTYDDGSLKAQYEHTQAGTLHGFYVAYYPGGRLKSRGQYVEGKMDGKWEYYGEDGKLARIEVYGEGGIRRSDVPVRTQELAPSENTVDGKRSGSTTQCAHKVDLYPDREALESMGHYHRFFGVLGVIANGVAIITLASSGNKGGLSAYETDLLINEGLSFAVCVWENGVGSKLVRAGRQRY
jgi:hypothetical protein